VPRGHPRRSIRQIANGALSNLSGDFAAMYARLGRPTIARELPRLEFDLLFR
jgi:hypothetical protein